MVEISDPKRKSGISILGDVPWGTHFCQFYRTKQDLIDILVPYFKTGLENNEFCMWVTSEPLTAEEARAALRKAVKDLDQYIKKGQIEILDFSQWYTKTGKFDADKVLQGWVDKEQQARKNGFEGLRFTGNTFWIEHKDWKSFSDYEATVNNVIHNYKMLGICTYSLDKCDANEILDVFSTHQFALINRNGKWATIESIKRTKAEETLRETSDYLENLFHYANAPIVVWDPQFRIIRFNRAFESLTGRSAYDVVGKSIEILFPPTLVQTSMERIAETLSGKRWEAVEIGILHRDGSVRTVLWNSATIFGPDRKTPVATIAQGCDITERKKAEETLMEEKVFSEGIFNTARAIILVLDAKGRIITFNKFMEELTGYSLDEVKGKDWFSTFLPEKDGEKIRGLFLRAISDTQIKGNINPIVAKDGRHIQMEWYANTLKKSSGELVGLISIGHDITERKLAEGALRESEERLRLAQISANVGIWDWNPRTGECVFTPELNQLYGLPPGTVKTYQDWHQRVHPDDIAMVEAQRDEAIANHKPFDSEFRIIHSSGEVRWISAKGGAFYNEAGETVRVLGVNVEITERKQAEMLIQQSEDRYRSLVENINFGISIIDRNFRIILMNSGQAKMNRKSVEQCIGQECFRIFEKREAVCPHCPGTIAMATGKPAEIETQGVRDDGSTLPVRVQAFPTFDQNGDVTGFIEVVEDITERKRAEEALNKSFQLLRDTGEMAKVGGWELDLSTKEVLLTEEVARIHGFEPGYKPNLEEALNFYAPESRPALEEVLKKAAETGEPYDLESLFIPSGGKDKIWVRSLGKAVYSGGKIVKLAGTFQNIDKYKRAEEALRRAKEDLERANADLEQAAARANELAAQSEAANIAKGQFLANMSHEIRTPMTAILGYADLLMASDLPPEKQQEFVQTIQRNGNALLSLINDILDLSSIEENTMPLEKSDCPLRQIVDDVISIVTLRAEEKGLPIQVEYDLSVPRIIHTDPARLRQILVNLVSNAVKFTQRGEVRITVRCKMPVGGRKQLQFLVSDTGIGIAPDEIGKLFQLFSQADGSTTRCYGGMGLGLAISQRFARMLGGDIEVQSQEGKGSTFTLTIDLDPLEGVQTDSAPPESPARIARPHNELDRSRLGGRILLAEDVPDVRRLIEEVLRQFGLEVDFEETGLAACQRAWQSLTQGRPYDLILMDIQMPKMDGYEATRRLRDLGWEGPIVALTAHAMVGDREKCLEAGCNDYIAKPVDANKFLEILSRFLGHKMAPIKSSVSGTDQKTAKGLLGSKLLDPTKVAWLIDCFLKELPARAERIETAFRDQKAEALTDCSHQLKGAAGMHGFAEIATAANEVCEGARRMDPWDQLETEVHELLDLCKKAMAQHPESVVGGVPAVGSVEPTRSAPKDDPEN
jgi:PAS domain S-box-containing protein